MDHQVGEHLHRVLLAWDVTEGHVDRPFHGPAGLNGLGRFLRRRVPRLLGIIAEEIPVQRAAHLGDGLARQEGGHPPALRHQVIDEHAHVPIGAGRGPVPLVVANGPHLLTERVQRPLVKLPDVGHSLAPSSLYRKDPVLAPGAVDPLRLPDLEASDHG